MNNEEFSNFAEKLDEMVSNMAKRGICIKWFRLYSLEDESKYELLAQLWAKHTYRELCDLLEKR